MIKIDSNVKLPVSKAARALEVKRRKIFRAFARAYKALYIIEPDTYKIENGMMAIYAGVRLCERASESRIVQLTRMMRERFLTR